MRATPAVADRWYQLELHSYEQVTASVPSRSELVFRIGVSITQTAKGWRVDFPDSKGKACRFPRQQGDGMSISQTARGWRVGLAVRTERGLVGPGRGGDEAAYAAVIATE